MGTVSTLSFGALLRQFRKAAELTQEELAEKAHISTRTIQDLERGLNRPRKYTVQQLADALSLKAAERAIFETNARKYSAPSLADQSMEHPLQNIETVQPTDTNAPQIHRPPLDQWLLAKPEHFIGRDRERAWLLERLRAGGIVGIAALNGLPGIGKTALAAVAVHQLYAEGRFRDGIAVVLCRDQTNKIDVLRHVLARFDPHRRMPETDEPLDLGEIAYQFLEGKDALVVLDGIEPGLAVEEVVIPLCAMGTTVLLTARHMLPRSIVPIEARLELDLLSPTEALDLFAKSYGKERATDLNSIEYTAAEHIIEILGRHTLAVKLAGAYATDLHRPLPEIAHMLEDPQRAIELPDGETPQAVAQICAQSAEALPPDARRLFVALAAFGTVDFGRNAALRIAGALGLTKPVENVELLVRRALVDASAENLMSRESDYERLHLHPLLRAFAASQFSRWSEEERDDAYHAVANYYVQYVEAISAKALSPDEINVIHALEWSHNHGQDALVAMLCLGMRSFWESRWRTSTSLTYLPWGIAAAEKVAGITNERLDRLCIADLKLAYVVALQRIGESQDAEEVLKSNLIIRREEQDRTGEGNCLFLLGQLARRQGRLEEAERYYQEALAIAREMQHWRGIVADLRHLGYLVQACGRLEEAKQYYEQSLNIRREMNDRQGEGVCLAALGHVAQDYGRLEEAERYYQEALLISREVQDLWSESGILRYQGQIALHRGQMEHAEQLLRQALALARKVRHRLGEGVVLCQLGQVVRQMGRLEEAEGYLHDALVIARKVPNRQGESKCLNQLAAIAETRGNLDRAETLYRESLAIGVEVNSNWTIADTLQALGRILIEKRHNYDEGYPMLLEAIKHYAVMGLPEEQAARELALRLQSVGILSNSCQ